MPGLRTMNDFTLSPRVTLNLGVRYDRYRAYWPEPSTCRPSAFPEAPVATLQPMMPPQYAMAQPGMFPGQVPMYPAQQPPMYPAQPAPQQPAASDPRTERMRAAAELGYATRVSSLIMPPSDFFAAANHDAQREIEETRKQFSLPRLFNSPIGWEIARTSYLKEMPYGSFLHYFWAWRALLGGLLIGVSESVFATLFNSTVALIASFAIVLLVIIVRPRGLLGMSTR